MGGIRLWANLRVPLPRTGPHCYQHAAALLKGAALLAATLAVLCAGAVAFLGLGLFPNTWELRLGDTFIRLSGGLAFPMVVPLLLPAFLVAAAAAAAYAAWVQRRPGAQVWCLLLAAGVTLFATLAGSIALLDLLQAQFRVSFLVLGFIPGAIPAALLLLLAGTGPAFALLALRADVRAWMAATPPEAGGGVPAPSPVTGPTPSLYVCPRCTKAYRLQKIPAPGTRCPPCSRMA